MKIRSAILAATRRLRLALSPARIAFCAIASALVLAPEASAQELQSESVATETIQAPLDKSIDLKVLGPVGKIVVSQPETVQVRAAGPDHVYVIGSEAGVTNLLVYDRDGRLTQTLDVAVGYDAQALRDLLAEALPGEPITVKGLSSTLLLEGEVSSPAVQAIAERLAERIAPDSWISRLHARQNQVRLEVRIVEVTSRALVDVSAALAIREGRNLLRIGNGPIGAEPPQTSAQLRVTPGGFSLDATLKALETRGELRIVAEPNLVTLSGETAQFLAGGEFPYPVPDGDKITVQFRPYGAAVTFQPTVQDNGLIRVRLDAQLSALDPANGLRSSTITVPALSMRRAATVADLRDGETLLIAGLFEDSVQRDVDQTPWLSDAPVIGPAFRSWRKTESRRELAFLVTATVGAEATSPIADEDAAPRGRPPVRATPTPPKTPISASAPRGPPLRLMGAEVRDALRPPVRWLKQFARRFVKTLTARA